MFSVIRLFRFINKKIRLAFWQWYHLNYCRKNNVKFSDSKTVRFFDKAVISISPKATVEIGKDFFVNSGPEEGIGTTVSKIKVGENAKLIIGDYVGISSTTMLVKNSVTIGNYVNIGGAVLLMTATIIPQIGETE